MIAIILSLCLNPTIYSDIMFPVFPNSEFVAFIIIRKLYCSQLSVLIWRQSVNSPFSTFVLNFRSMGANPKSIVMSNYWQNLFIDDQVGLSNDWNCLSLQSIQKLTPHTNAVAILGAQFWADFRQSQESCDFSCNDINNTRFVRAHYSSLWTSLLVFSYSICEGVRPFRLPFRYILYFCFS